MYPFRQIVVATDFGPSSARALELATGVAREYDAELTVVHAVEVVTPPYPIALTPDPATLEAAAQAGLSSIVERLQSSLPRARGVLLRGAAAAQIIEYAKTHDVDLLVVGTHGRHGAARWLMGSVAEKVVRGCRAPVLTVRETDLRAGDQPAPSERERERERAPRSGAEQRRS